VVEGDGDYAVKDREHELFAIGFIIWGIGMIFVSLAAIAAMVL
jgi:hypothetical protein